VLEYVATYLWERDSPLPEPAKAKPIEATNYIEEAINEDILAGKVKGCVHTRLPPEPNGYLHIGHAKNIYINAGIAEKYGGLCNLRFDDTNPAKEDTEYVEAIMRDIRWLGYDWTGGLFFGSQYFGKCCEFAEKLIRKGKAYVCDLTQDETREYRGTLTEPGKNSPYRGRAVDENLDLFRRMRAGEFGNGARVLRAKIDMASPNINMRDPVIYRILHISHHQTGDEWCIYPMYDFAHPIQDALEGITHSLCSLEYEDHRPLYDWVINELEFEHKPRQIEYARLNLTNTVMSKRYLRQLVEEKLVSGWDDPRMPTLCGLRRRGYTPASIRDFIVRAGVAKADSVVDIRLLEHCIREELNETAPRAMAVLDPVKVVLTNWPEGKTEEPELENHPGHPEMGARKVTFSRNLFIEREDFMEDPPPKYFRLKPGGEVRLKGAYIIRCDEVVKDANGNVAELRCSYDPESKSGESDRKVKGTLHWVEAGSAVPAEIRLYDVLFNDNEGEDYAARLNAGSRKALLGCLLEGGLAFAAPGARFQFMRQGYFICDADSQPGRPVFNRIVGLKDSWAKEMGKEG
jgi:glutaminyl-tRNA synthetase